jgi:REP element-mobilizing transposase RayT
MSDHVHLFVAPPPTVRPSDLVKVLKGVSARILSRPTCTTWDTLGPLLLIAAGRPKKLTSKTAKPYCPDRIPSAVINQALRDVAAHPKVEKFRVLWPGFNNQNCRLERVGSFWTVGFPTHVGRVRVPLEATDRQAQLLAKLGATVKQGAAKLYEKRGRWYLALSIFVQVTPCVGTSMKPGRKRPGPRWLPTSLGRL